GGTPGPWKIQYATDTLAVLAPEVWFLRKYGLLRTAFGALPPHRVLRANEVIDERVLPAVEVSDAAAKALNLKDDVDSYSEQDWASFKLVADRWTAPGDDDRRAEFYSWLVGHVVPETLVVRVGARCQAVKL